MPDSEAKNDPGPSSKNKRVRTVQSLTEVQIQKKRIVDRRAQQAFRQRNKDTVSSLNKELAELQESYNQKEQELNALQRRYQKLEGLINAVIKLGSDAAHLKAEAHHSILGFPGGSSQSGASAGDSQNRMRTTLLPHSGQSYSQHINPPTLTSDTNNNLIEPKTSSSPSKNNTAGSEHSETCPYLPTPHQAHHMPSSLSGYNPLLSIPGRSDTLEAYNVLPLHFEPTCPLDHIFHRLIISRRAMLCEGIPLEDVLGPSKPSVKAILSSKHSSSVHHLSGVLSGVVSTYPGFKRPERFAFFYLMMLSMKWQISRTHDNYLAMPSWLRPTVTQVMTPHPIWIDNIPWPGMRDILIQRADELPHPIFSSYFSPNVSVNWPHGSLDAIWDIDGEANLHRDFEKHVRNLNNWTMSAEFQGQFLYMADAVNTYE